jgi:hypothetical protein
MAADQQRRVRHAGGNVVVQDDGRRSRKQRLGAGAEIRHDQATDVLPAKL